MSINKRQDGKKRRAAGETRAAALEAATSLLLEVGPQAVTLKAVAARIGCTHGNLLHHFGSAEELQKSLALYMTTNVSQRIVEAVHRRRAGEGDVRDAVNLIFDAFGKGGGAALVSWMTLTDNAEALEPIMSTVDALVQEIAYDGQTSQSLYDAALMTISMAIGDALVGEPMLKEMGFDRDHLRGIAARLMRTVIMNVEGVPESWAESLMLNREP